METSFNEIFLATLAFVGGHFLLSTEMVRRAFVPAWMPERIYRGVFAVLMLAAFVWMVRAYYAGPYYSVWYPPAAFAWIPALVMPISSILLVGGLTTPSPTMVGGAQFVLDAASGPPVGFVTITRHPFLWGTALWAASHLCVRGDLASMIMMGGILILSLGGMWHIDQRREASLGAAWGPVKLTTSALPFAAVASGRAAVDWRGIGWWRPAGGIALYIGILLIHERFIGFDPLPQI